MQVENIKTRVAASDADYTTIRTAIDKDSDNLDVAVVGEDIDLVVLLSLHLWLTPTLRNF